MQGGLPTAIGTTSFVHELEHDEDIHHHHEDDGSVHYDESDESLDHAQEHSSSSQPAGFGLQYIRVTPEQQAMDPGTYIAVTVPDPCLKGPQRPPALSLGQPAGGMLHS